MKYLTLLLLPLVTGCALGSAGSIASFYACEANRLTPAGERALVDRIEQDMMMIQELKDRSS